MFNKEYVNKVLRINGLSSDASDEDLRSVLLYAKCENVDDAISALRDANVKANDDICGLQKTETTCNILLADKRLRPETIRDLLGIDMQVTYDELESAREKRRSVSFVQIAGIFGWSLFCALLSLAGFMWYFGIGLFHPGM